MSTMIWPTNVDKFGPDRIPVVTGLSGSDGETVVPIAVDPLTGNILTSDEGASGGLVPVPYDALTYTATSGTVDTFRYYTGGTGGMLVATVTVTYTDSGHGTLVSVVRTE